MSATVTLDTTGGRTFSFPHKLRRGTITLGSSYTTNGVVITNSQFELYHSLTDLRVDSTGGYIFQWDKTNAKVKAYRQKDPGNAGGADIPLPEVANGVDLSAISARFRAEGR